MAIRARSAAIEQSKADYKPGRRTVFPSGMVAHVWAQQQQYKGRNGRSSFYFEGDTIYSYGRHFPIARFVDLPRRRGKVVLFTTESRSTTTSSHRSVVRSALHGLPHRIFNVPHIDPNSQRGALDNLADYRQRIERMLVKASRARTNAEWYLTCAAELKREALDYAKAFGLSNRKETRAIAALEMDGAEAKKIIERTRAAKAKAEAKAVAERKRQQQEAAATIEELRGIVADVAAGRSPMPDDLPQLARSVAHLLGDDDAQAVERVFLDHWRNGGTNYMTRSYLSINFVDRLRLSADGTAVETNRAAEIPADHARRVWPILNRIRQGYPDGLDRIESSIRVGHFEIDGVDADGTVHVGCHRIPWSEIELMARELRLIA